MQNITKKKTCKKKITTFSKPFTQMARMVNIKIPVVLAYLRMFISCVEFYAKLDIKCIFYV